MLHPSAITGKTQLQTAPARVPGFPANDAEFQSRMLQGVSRTFALTIPQLPPGLGPVVGNAYLLCRIADTIEDDPEMTADRKQYLAERFLECVRARGSAEAFAAELGRLLSHRAPVAERELVAGAPRIIGLAQGFSRPTRAAIERCLRVMVEGMVWFQRHKQPGGLRDLGQLDHYCYCVAGVVGEMLTELFCEYSPATARSRERLLALSVSFGQGLQMTNILKDVWEDRERGACWLPRSVFRGAGVGPENLHEARGSPGFGQAIEPLVGIAHGHLRNALAYTQLIPGEERGIRKFCAWAAGMALLTLQKINRRRDYACGAEVKISRRAVRATILAANLAVGNDRLLRFAFELAASGLPRPTGRGRDACEANRVA